MTVIENVLILSDHQNGIQHKKRSDLTGFPQSEGRQRLGNVNCRLKLQHIATALLPEGVGFLGAEANKQAVLLLMVVDELDDVLGSLRHEHPLKGCFAP